jgi:hypothetical protein
MHGSRKYACRILLILAGVFYENKNVYPQKLYLP